MTLVSVRLAIVAVAAWAVSVSAQNPLNDARTALEKWVETRQLISKTRGDWQSDKETIEQTIHLLERELEDIAEKTARLGTNSTQVEKERLQAEALLESSNGSLDRTKQFATEFEREIARLVPQLPAPLQDILKPSLNKLPADPASTTMTAAQRAQLVVGILTEFDKFNNAVTIFSEKRKNAKDEEVAVETVYVGLGAAYFVNDSNDFAGTGTPGSQGWEWTVKPELAPAIREVIRIYRNERGARFVALPAVIR